MASLYKVAASQGNGRKSHGPRSVVGKTRSRLNARKHGLSIPIRINRDRNAQMLKIAHSIAGEGATPDMLEQASIIAECELDIQRVKQARIQAMMFGLLPRRAAKQQSAATTDRSPAKDLDNNPAKTTRMFLRALPQLDKLKRYERHAYARRNKALTHLQGLRVLTTLHKKQ